MPSWAWATAPRPKGRRPRIATWLPAAPCRDFGTCLLEHVSASPIPLFTLPTTTLHAAALNLAILRSAFCCFSSCNHPPRRASVMSLAWLLCCQAEFGPEGEIPAGSYKGRRHETAAHNSIPRARGAKGPRALSCSDKRSMRCAERSGAARASPQHAGQRRANCLCAPSPLLVVLGQLGDLADGDGAPLIAQREAPHGRQVLEGLHAQRLLQLDAAHAHGA